MNIILIGMKGVGKSTIGSLLAQSCSVTFVEVDERIEKKFEQMTGIHYSCREIYQKKGRTYFRNLETQALAELRGIQSSVISTGGGLPLDPKNQTMLAKLGTIIFLDEQFDVIADRIQKTGVPSFIKNKKNMLPELRERYYLHKVRYHHIADHTVICTNQTPHEIVDEIRIFVRLCNK